MAITTVSLIRGTTEIEMLPIQLNCETLSHIFGVRHFRVLKCTKKVEGGAYVASVMQWRIRGAGGSKVKSFWYYAYELSTLTVCVTVLWSPKSVRY